MIKTLSSPILFYLEKLCQVEVELKEEALYWIVGSFKTKEPIQCQVFEELADEVKWQRFGGVTLYFHNRFNPSNPNFHFTLKLNLQIEDDTYAFTLSLEKVLKKSSSNQMLPIPIKEWPKVG